MKTQIEDGSTAETPGYPAANVRSEQLRDRFGLLSPDDLSALIGADPRTLAVRRATGKGPDFTKAGRAIYYRQTDVGAWLALNVVPVDRSA